MCRSDNGERDACSKQSRQCGKSRLHNLYTLLSIFCYRIEILTDHRTVNFSSVRPRVGPALGSCTSSSHHESTCQCTNLHAPVLGQGRTSGLVAEQDTALLRLLKSRRCFTRAVVQKLARLVSGFFRRNLSLQRCDKKASFEILLLHASCSTHQSRPGSSGAVLSLIWV